MFPLHFLATFSLHCRVFLSIFGEVFQSYIFIALDGCIHFVSPFNIFKTKLK